MSDPRERGPGADDARLIATINARTDAGLELRGRAATGKLGGAVFVTWPDGRAGVVTLFHGPIDDARRLAASVNQLCDRGLPVPRHDLVVDLGSHSAMVQERLPAASPGPLTPTQVEGIWAINERFAGAAAGVTGLPALTEWFRQPDPEIWDRLGRLAGHRRTREIAARIRSLTSANSDLLAGDDVVHVDLNAANVLFDDQDGPVGVVDWGLGVYRGDRRGALVQTRFDREWFVRAPDADPDETAAAYYLDQLLGERIDPDELRVFWAFWLGHHLSQVLNHDDPAVINWQLDLAESRLG